MAGSGSKRLPIGVRLRNARVAAGLSQRDVADRIGVKQPTVSQWETGSAKPSVDARRRLEEFLEFDGETPRVVDTSAFGDWLDETRRERGMTRGELAKRSGISEMQIGNIERGDTRNPRAQTRERLRSALQADVPERIEAEASASAEIPGVGSLEDFDPHNRTEYPREPGVYVLYDVSERPIYVGRAQSVGRRLRDHEDKFWYKAPIVQSASFVRIDDERLRNQIEQVLIKFLKSNAVINQQSVAR